MEKKNERYDLINILRMLCAYLVIIIHTGAFRSLGDNAFYITNQFICRISVPFFFIAAGYFFYPKANKEGYMKKYILKLVKIYISGTIVYSAVYFSAFFTEISQAFAMGGLEYTLKTYLVNSISGTMWYFPELIMSITIVYIFLKKNLIKSLIGVSILLLLIGLMGDTYYGLIVNTPFIHIVNAYDVIFDNTRNGITFGVPFITIGALINRNKLNEIIKNPVIFLVLFGIVFIGEGYFLMNTAIPKDYNIYFSATLVVPVIFIMALNSKVEISDKLSNYMREMSVWIYVFHILIPTLLFLVNIEITNSIVMYLSVCIIVTLLAFIITKIKFRKKDFSKADVANIQVKVLR